MSVSKSKPRKSRRLPSLPLNSGQQQLELSQRGPQSPAQVDVERLSKLPPHILKQLRSVENDPAILAGKVIDEITI